MKNFQPEDYLIVKDKFDRITSNWEITIKRFPSLKRFIDWIIKNSDWYLDENVNIKDASILDLNIDDGADVCQVYYLKVTSKGIKRERIL